MLVQAAGRHTLHVARQDDAAIGAGRRQKAYQVIPLPEVGLVLSIVLGPGHVPIHGRLCVRRPLAAGHDINQAHDIAVARTAHQHRPVSGCLFADHQRCASGSPSSRCHGNTEDQQQDHDSLGTGAVPDINHSSLPLGIFAQVSDPLRMCVTMGSLCSARR